ncbi:PEP-CTERM protein-sorting domain-containing protein [Marinobacter segnicrescens]|uniref:PEP-CTERM protein-sorting domain-containing protein n=1 Tax=Marinobacter segnicrescens TaxID=430453 RepID=A0A1H9ZSV9_9GAMM|nr:PEP-CTERM sorting domain-containing protein [Marinobacter segnicrescens]SES83892.1 PEP-CTERM protein-sorting domain-containing protein [Marinobacter segnicrescens]
MKKRILLGIAAAAISAQPASAALISWTDWTSATNGAAGSASGTMGSVSVEYSGDVNFAQLGTGTNYWTEGTPAPYTASSFIDNAPTASEMIAMSRSGITNTITFSSAVVNPIFAIVSQGRNSLPVSYDFDRPFTVLSEGEGYWGNGTYTVSGGDILTGNEFHGAIQFQGIVNSLSWEADPEEFWHGFTVGVAAVPEPGTLALLTLGLAGLVTVRSRSS